MTKKFRDRNIITIIFRYLINKDSNYRLWPIFLISFLISYSCGFLLDLDFNFSNFIEKFTGTVLSTIGIIIGFGVGVMGMMGTMFLDPSILIGTMAKRPNKRPSKVKEALLQIFIPIGILLICFSILLIINYISILRPGLDINILKIDSFKIHSRILILFFTMFTTILIIRVFFSLSYNTYARLYEYLKTVTKDELNKKSLSGTIEIDEELF